MRIGLVQINMSGRSPTSKDGTEPPPFGLLPYSVGLLKSYAITHATEQHEWMVPVYRRLSVGDAADKLRGADVVGLSTYIWNVRLSLAIAKEVKRRQPDTLIVAGGPQVPDRPAAAEAFLREHPYVDVVCQGEGEVVFTALLDHALTRDFSGVPGISFLDRNGKLETHPKAPRLKDLEEIPSPYTSGAFDDLFVAQPDHRWVMIWETNRGCPFSCAFCDWGSAIASKVYRFDMDRLTEEIGWMAQKRIAFVWTADANFGALKRDYDIAEQVVGSYKSTGYPSSITVQSTKNATERAYRIQKLLQGEMNAYGVTLSLQSVNHSTLDNINRANISSDMFRELQRRFAAEGVYTYTDLILGLPGETYEQFASGVSQVIADGQHNHVQLFPCSVLPNAEMGDPEYQARFGMKTRPQVIRSILDEIDEAEWEVPEYIDTVVSTDAMPPEAWCRARVFAWMVDFTYYDRVLQIPLLILHARHDWPVHEMVEALMDADPQSYPVVGGLVATLREKAQLIQDGGPDYFPIREARGLLWSGDLRCLISLVLEDSVDDFYAEAGEVLGAMIEQRGVAEDRVLLDEALTLNRAALTLPFQPKDQLIALSHNLWEHYQSLLVADAIPIDEEIVFHRIVRSRDNWDTIDDWAEHLGDAQGKDKRRLLYPIFSPRRARPPAMAAAATA
jgi:tRNA A37 methylthiotransferase MiaB